MEVGCTQHAKMALVNNVLVTYLAWQKNIRTLINEKKRKILSIFPLYHFNNYFQKTKYLRVGGSLRRMKLRQKLHWITSSKITSSKTWLKLRKNRLSKKLYFLWTLEPRILVFDEVIFDKVLNIFNEVFIAILTKWNYLLIWSTLWLLTKWFSTKW